MKPVRHLLFAGLLAILPASLAQQAKERTDPFQHPHAHPVDDPALPRVLIIGDSISVA